MPEDVPKSSLPVQPAPPDCSLCDAPKPSGAVVTHDDWEKAFKMVELENNLAHHRFTALLTLQGFLFTALVFGSSGLAQASSAEPRFRLQIQWALVVVCLVGIVSPMIVLRGLRAAYRQIKASAAWLDRIWRCKEHVQRYPFPPLTGIRRQCAYGMGLRPDETDDVGSLTVGTLLVPWLLTGTWALILCLIAGVMAKLIG